MTATTSITKITDKTQSSSYIGFTTRNTDGSTVTNLKALKNSDDTLNEYVHYAPYIGDHPTYPGTTPVLVNHELITSRLPRHGEKISSAQILPPYLLYSAFGDHIMQNSSSMGPNDKRFMFVEGADMNTLVRKRSRIFQTECYHQYITNPLNVDNAPDAAIVTALGNFVNGYKNQTIEYATTVGDPQSISTSFYTRRINVTHKFVISSNASGTIIIYAELGSCNVTFDTNAPTNLNLVVICGNGTIDVVSPGATRKLLLIGGTNINITDGAPIPSALEVTSNIIKVSNDTVTKGTGMVATLLNYATIGISSRYGIQKVYDTEMYEQATVFYKFEEDPMVPIQRYQVTELDANVSSSIDESSHLQLIAKQFKYQYGVTCTVDSAKRMIKSTFWGDHHAYTSVARQLSVTKLQSLNVISEVFDTSNYHEMMAETFRVNEYAYAFAMLGKYMTVNERADIVFSSDDVELLAEVEYLNAINTPTFTQVITPDVLAVNASTPTQPNGGSDPIFMGMSKYRKLAVVPTELRTESVFIGSSSQSLVKYQPVNGKIISVNIPDDKVSSGNVFLRDYKLHEHGLCLRNKYPSKTTGFTLIARVKKTKKAGAVLHHRVNAAEYYHGDESVDVIYQDENEVTIRVENATGDMELIHLLLNGDAKTSTVYSSPTVEYKYISTGTSPEPVVHKLQSKTSLETDFTDLMTLVHDTLPQPEEDVKLFVMFPSLLLTAISNFVDVVTNTSDAILPYAAMNTDGSVQCVISSFQHAGDLPLTQYYTMGHDIIDISNLPYELSDPDNLVDAAYMRTSQNLLVRRDDFGYVRHLPTGETDTRCAFLFLGRKGYDAYVHNERIQYLPAGPVYPEQQLDAHRLNGDGFLEPVVITIDTAGKVSYSDFSFVFDNSVNSVHFVDGGQRHEHTLEQFVTVMLPMIRSAFETVIKSHTGLKITLTVENDGGLKIGSIEREDPESTLPSTLLIMIDDVPYYFTIHTGVI